MVSSRLKSDDILQKVGQSVKLSPLRRIAGKSYRRLQEEACRNRSARSSLMVRFASLSSGFGLSSVSVVSARIRAKSSEIRGKINHLDQPHLAYLDAVRNALSQ